MTDWAGRGWVVQEVAEATGFIVRGEGRIKTLKRLLRSDGYR